MSYERGGVDTNEMTNGFHPDKNGRMSMSELDDELARVHPEAFAWALAVSGWDRQEAEDVLQTVYLEILDGRARFAGASSFRTWLFAVIRRTASRRRLSRLVSDNRLVRWLQARPVSSPADSTERPVLLGESSRVLTEALGRLSTRQRRVLELVFFLDLTVEEAAEVMRMPVGTARAHYARGKKRLRLLLEEEDRT